MVTVDYVENEIKSILKAHGELSAAFITRFLHERGVDCTRQKVERVLRSMVDRGILEAFYWDGNKRKHYRVR
ncbi:MAG: hypothetical protein PWQ79_641 [Thermococcaceae archaeon]|nr:hypothetical protein [Thermococcaceae archaeon]MDK2913726.1 hypothetical protein [Thermococcaceae archaeon]